MNQLPLKNKVDGAVLQFRHRHYFMVFALSSLLAGLVGRAVYLTVVDSEFLRKQGDARSLRIEPVMAMRGMILDRNGAPLAVSTPVVSIWINPRQALAGKASISTLERDLALPAGSLVARVNRNARKGFMYAKRHLSPTAAELILAKDMPGVYGMTEYRRFYPEADVTSHMIGFTDLDDQGKEGLELSLNDQLAGEAGIKRVVKDLKGHRVQDVALIKPAHPGKDITLSFDTRVQYAAYRELARGVAEHNATAGVLVSLDVDTGEVLAMANLPSYNPNNRKQLTVNALRNRAVTDQFEPGSTLKPFTVAAALESGKFNAHSHFNTNPGTFKVLNKLIRDHENYGVIDMPTLLTKSSNVAAAQIAMALPRDTLPLLHRRLGFGHSTGSGFPGESAGSTSKRRDRRPAAAHAAGVPAAPRRRPQPGRDGSDHGHHGQGRRKAHGRGAENSDGDGKVIATGGIAVSATSWGQDGSIGRRTDNGA